jgi:hypothetical protein
VDYRLRASRDARVSVSIRPSGQRPVSDRTLGLPWKASADPGLSFCLDVRRRALASSDTPERARIRAGRQPGLVAGSIIAIPWSSPVPATVKGIIHVPAHNTPIKAGRREPLLIAIVKARQWIDDLAHGRAASFAVIARREGKAERHIRLLAPLAFVSPRILSALLDGTAPADLTLTKLARALPYCWAEQEHRE